MHKNDSKPKLFARFIRDRYTSSPADSDLSSAQPYNKELAIAFLVFILISALCVFFAAFSSPFFRYSTNSDSNVYFSVARAMQNGLLPYRDVFDHKGVFLYLIYYVAVWMTPTNMNGVYILLTISSAVTMLYGFRLARLFLPSIPAMISALSIILFSTGSPVYENGGGSTEEFFMPCIMACLFYLVRHQIHLHGKIVLSGVERFSGAFIGGIFCAVILWVKYSSLAVLFIPYLIFVTDMLFRKQIRETATYIGSFLMGAAALSVIPISYLWRHELFADFWNTYIVFNLDYASSETAFNIATFLQMMLLAALIPTTYTLLGMGYLSKKVKVVPCRCFWLVASHALSLIFFIVALKKAFPYYFLLFAPMTVFGSVAIAYGIRRYSDAINRQSISRNRHIILALISIMLLIGIVIAFSSTRWRLGSVVFPQTSVEKSASSVNDYWAVNGDGSAPDIVHFACNDKGLYELCHTYPQQLYFYQPYVEGEAAMSILREQAQYIREGRVDFVVYYSKSDERIDLESLNSDYFLLYEDVTPSDSNFFSFVYAKK